MYYITKYLWHVFYKGKNLTVYIVILFTKERIITLCKSSKNNITQSSQLNYGYYFYLVMMLILPLAKNHISQEGEVLFLSSQDELLFSCMNQERQIRG